MKDSIRIQYLKTFIYTIRHASEYEPDLRSAGHDRLPGKRARTPAQTSRRAVGRVRTRISSPMRLEPFLQNRGRHAAVVRLGAPSGRQPRAEATIIAVVVAIDAVRSRLRAPARGTLAAHLVTVNAEDLSPNSPTQTAKKTPTLT